jgi:transposase
MVGQRQRPGENGGGATGPDPTNRAKSGTNRHRVVDRAGAPLAVCLAGANRHDSLVVEDLIDAIPRLRQPNGRRRKRPVTLHADKAYDHRRCRRALTQRHIKVRIAHKGVERRDRLGRRRWVVERTPAWLGQVRRLTARDERREDVHHASVSLGCSLICFNALARF